AADNQLGMVMLESTLSLRSKATVSVFAANGTQVYGAEGDMIDLSHLAKGVYVVKGQTELAQQIIKICIR
ncbi:MAG: T9SS type A sorting domain-containing protein, partial [Bacteroidales bacterium]